MRNIIGGFLAGAALFTAFAVMQPVDAGYTHPTTTRPVYTTTTTVPQTTTTTTCPDCTPNTVVATTTTTTEVVTSTSTSTTIPQTTTSSLVETTTTTSLPLSTTSTTTTVPVTSTSSTTSTTLPETSSTTTSTSTTTTTTLPETFTFGAAGTVCIREVPKIRITFENRFPSLAGQTGTLTMRDINGNVVSVQPLVYQPGTTVDILYPGTSVNPDGSIDDVPGWILTDDGFWIQDSSDAFLREGIFLTYTVNPTAGPVLVTYPPESSACANPSGPFPPPRLVPGELPPTL